MTVATGRRPSTAPVQELWAEVRSSEEERASQDLGGSSEERASQALDGHSLAPRVPREGRPEERVAEQKAPLVPAHPGV